MEKIGDELFSTYKEASSIKTNELQGHMEVDGKLLKVKVGENTIIFPMAEVRKVFMDA